MQFMNRLPLPMSPKLRLLAKSESPRTTSRASVLEVAPAASSASGAARASPGRGVPTALSSSGCRPATSSLTAMPIGIGPVTSSGSPKLTAELDTSPSAQLCSLVYANTAVSAPPL
jgi:hypothetical protein